MDQFLNAYASASDTSRNKPLIQSTDLWLLPGLANVTTLEVQVGVDAFFQSWQQRCPPWKCDYDSRDVDQLEITRRVSTECTSLRAISISDGGCDLALTDGELATWRSNLTELEKMLQLRIDLRNQLPKQTLPLVDAPEPPPSCDEKPEQAIRTDSVQCHGLPLYAPESQADCDDLEVDARFSGSIMRALSPHESADDRDFSNRSLVTLLEQTGVPRSQPGGESTR